MSEDQASAVSVHKALCELRTGAPKLRARDPDEILDSLCAVLDSWREPESPWRARLERALPSVSGFSEAMIREGLTRALEGWTGDALRTLVERELGTEFRGEPAATGFDTTAVLLAGAIPMPTLLALLLPLVLRSPVLAKTSARDPLTARLVAESIRRCDPELGTHLEVVSFPGSDADSTEALLKAPCVVAYGSDATIAAVAARMPTGNRLIAHGHRLSVAVMGERATRGPVLYESCKRLALDTSLWDQLGCLSPVAVYVEDREGGAGERVATALAQAMSDATGRWPRGELAATAALEISNERAQAEMRVASGRRGAVHGGAELAWTVVLEADAHWRASPLHRFLRVHPTSSRSELRAALAPIAKHLSTVALCGLGDAAGSLERELSSLGVSRICGPGEMQTPPIGWQNDGKLLLRPLVRAGA